MSTTSDVAVFFEKVGKRSNGAILFFCLRQTIYCGHFCFHWFVCKSTRNIYAGDFQILLSKVVGDCTVPTCAAARLLCESGRFYFVREVSFFLKSKTSNVTCTYIFVHCEKTWTEPITMSFLHVPGVWATCVKFYKISYGSIYVTCIQVHVHVMYKNVLYMYKKNVPNFNVTLTLWYNVT